MRSIRIFVSSPSDLKPEREAISGLVDEFNKDPVFRERYKFIAMLYEEMTPSFIGEIPQEVVNQQMLRASEADLVICMFWSRFGSPLRGIELNPDTNRPYESGTEYEFYDAYRNYKASGKPILALYRCERERPKIDETAPPEKIIEIYKQREKVDEFFRRVIGQDATIEGMSKDFKSTEDLVKLLRLDLRLHSARWIKEEEAATTPRRRLVELLPQLLPILILLAIVIGFLVYSLVPQIPPIEPGAFNIAIAGFVASPDSGISSADAKVLSDSFYKTLQNQMDGLKSELELAVGVWSPDQVGAIEGASAQEREQNAANRVTMFRETRHLQVDIIVYGVIQKQPDPFSQEPRIALLPEFYVASPNPELADVLGRFDMQAALSAPNTNLLPALSAELTDRSKILSFITQGLVLSIVQPPQFENAYQAFNEALTEINVGESGQELVRVLMANTRLSQYNRNLVYSRTSAELDALASILDDIQDQFSAARDANLNYSRAYIGLATTQYLRLIDSVESRSAWREIEDDTIIAIEDLYQQALDSDDQPTSADIPTKVAFGMGQLQVLRYLRGEGQAWDAAKGYFDQVIADYGSGVNERVREQAAQATGYIGLLYRQKNDYDAAAQAYQAAIDLTQLDTRRRVFRRSLLQMTFDLKRAAGEIEAAEAAAVEMLDLTTLPRDEAIILFHLGKMYSENERDQEALATYQLGVGELRGSDNAEDTELVAKFWAMIGDIQSESGQLIEAIEAYEQALLLDPATYGHLDRVIDNLSTVTAEAG